MPDSTSSYVFEIVIKLGSPPPHTHKDNYYQRTNKNGKNKQTKKTTKKQTVTSADEDMEKMETHAELPKELNVELPFQPAIPPLGIFRIGSRIWETFVHMHAKQHDS